MPSAPQLATLPAFALGLIGLTTGLYSLYSPTTYASTLGIPLTSSSSPATPFVIFTGARNISGSAALLTLLATGQRKAAGTYLLAGVLTSMVDAWVCSRFGAEEGKAVGHAVGGVVVGIVGGVLFWG